MERISIQDLASSVFSTKRGIKKKDAERFATILFDVVKDGLATDRVVKVKGLGTFKVIDIDARESINVNTGERVVIEGHNKITFTPDTMMKEVVNRPFSQFETVVLNEGVEFDDTPAYEDESITESEENEKLELSQEELNAPEIQDTPVIPETTDLPETADLPEIADLSETTEIPEAAEIPETADISETTDLPEASEVQETPEIPDSLEIIETQETTGNLEVQESTGTPETLLEFCESNEEISPIEEEEKQIQNNDDMETSIIEKTRIPLVWWLILLAACVGSFGAGYYFGEQSGKNNQLAAIESVRSTDEAMKTDSTPKDVKPLVPQTKEEPVSESMVDSVQTSKEEPVQKSKPEPLSSDQYEMKDARVRTGAYRIIGTDSEVRVRAGETMSRIAKRTLGPDMECYIEVYNNIKGNAELKEGQLIKIPKLELKKKKMKK